MFASPPCRGVCPPTFFCLTNDEFLAFVFHLCDFLILLTMVESLLQVGPPKHLQAEPDWGKICLSILDEAKDWKPSITLKQILLGIQDLLDNPNASDPAQSQATQLMRADLNGYNAKIRRQAAAMVPGQSNTVTVL